MIAATALGQAYGAKTIFRDLSLSVSPAEVLVVTGPNGCGKTTLLRILCGLQAPTRGALELAVDRRRIGFLGHEPLVYRELTAVENLDLYGRLYRISDRRARVDAMLERFGLGPARSERVSRYSRGMIQRLALCRALLHEPDLVILDEPHTALDDDGGALVDRELATLIAAGRTLVLSTHDPERVARLATQRLALGGGGAP